MDGWSIRCLWFRLDQINSRMSPPCKEGFILTLDGWVVVGYDGITQAMECYWVQCRNRMGKARKEIVNPVVKWGYRECH